MTFDSNDERTKILQRIANLRARANDDASSEAEVMTAMNRAEKLMESYRVTEADLAIAESEGRVKIEIVEKSVRAANGSIRHKCQLCWSAIGRLTNTKSVRYSRSNEIRFTGDVADVEYAIYLMELIRGGMDRAYAAYRRETGGATGRNAKASFQIAMAQALNTRLYAMCREAEAERKEARARAGTAKLADLNVSDSRALVIADAFEDKRKATEEAFTKAHPRLRTGPGWSSGGSHNRSAGSAGAAAGQRLGLGRGIGGGGNQRALA